MRGRAVEALALAVREHALIRVMAYRMQRSDAEDIVHDKLARWVEEITAGRVDAGKEDAWVGRSAWNAANSWWRARKVRRETSASELEEDAALAAGSVEDDVLEAERVWDEAALFEQVRALLPKMPAAYREVLEAHYLQGVLIADLVEVELKRDRAAGKVERGPTGEDAARKKCRARIDARLSRARRWLEDRATREAK